MEYNELKELVGSYPAGYIKFKARQIVESMGKPQHDIEDVEQELVIETVQKRPLWDETKRTWNSFVKLIVDRKICGLIDEWKAAKRGFGVVTDADITEVDHLHTENKVQANQDLPIDMERFLDSIPDNVTPYAVALQALNGHETARVYGVSFSTVTRYKRMLRDLMAKEGLKKYLAS